MWGLEKRESIMKKIILVLALTIAACGGGSDTITDTGPDSTDPVTPTNGETTGSTAASTTAPAGGPAPSGDAGIAITIGGETWNFANALCAFYDAPAGEPGSRWNVSAIQNGSFTAPDVQVYVNFEDPDTYLELNDFIADTGWSAQKDTLTIDVNGNDVTASATFANDDTGETAEGSLTATCSSWHDAS